MKFGIQQRILSEYTTLTATVGNEPGKETSNVLSNDTFFTWEVEQGTATLLAVFDYAVETDLIGLFNVAIDTSVIISVYEAYPGTVTETKTVLVSELCGLYEKNAYFELSQTRSLFAIKMEFTGVSSLFLTSLGYLWAGLLENLGCAEAIQPGDISNDDVNISRTNHPDTEESYDYQTFDVTVKKENDFETLRASMRQIINTGFSTPRPWLIDEPFFTVPEVVLGMLDSGKIKYDIIPTDDNDGFLSQVTIGIREVF